MAALKSEGLGPQESRPARQAEETIRRLALYFRSTGLPEEHAAAMAQQITAEAGSRLDETPQDLRAAALEQAMTMTDDWLDRVAAKYNDESWQLRRQLRWFLRPVIADQPEMFGKTEGLSEDFRRAVQRARDAVLPEPAPTNMPAQKLGQLPRLWYRLTALFGMCCEGLAHLVSRIWTNR